MARTLGTSSYDDQLLELGETYRDALTTDLDQLRALLAAVGTRPCVFVGSGGALAVARFAAELHERRTRTFARSATPLELRTLLPSLDAAMVIFSAGARHADTRRAIQLAARAGIAPIGLVTHRPTDDFEGLAGYSAAWIVSIPLERRDGFLATHSTLAMATMLLRATNGAELPSSLPAFDEVDHPPLRRSVVVLVAPGYRAVGTDLETRLAETGVAQAQVTDYRNFAHGRHHGLSRNLDDTTIVALVDPDVKALADATLRQMPAEAHIVQLTTRLKWPIGVLDLLVGSMRLLAPTARCHGLDPARPRVPEFGRRLYHLSSGQTPASNTFDAVSRKLAVLGLLEHRGLRSGYEDALDEWLTDVQQATIGGVVVDYDGTVCETDRRFEPPEPSVRAAFLSLLEAGVVVGFASGRGSSLHRELRSWLPFALWERVELGLYNGGLLLTLDQPLEPSNGEGTPFATIEESLRDGPFSELIDVEARPHQIGVQGRAGGVIGPGALAQLASELAARTPGAALKAVASAHSVDIVPASSSKRAVLDRVLSRVDGATVAIGDQGQLGGNDFELLAATRWSLSVDRCSADPTRCWNLDLRGQRGPLVLDRYLRALKIQRRGVRFRWPRST